MFAARLSQFLLALAFIGPGHFFLEAAAEDFGSVKVRADGFAEGSGRSAETKALADAEAAAVELVIGDIVDERWLNKLDAVFAQTSTYVRTSRPVETKREAEGVRTRAEVYVFKEQLRRDIAAVLFNSLPTKPKVAVIFGEEIAGYRNWTAGEGAGQRFFEKRLSDAGFDVVDPTNRYTPENLMAYQSGNAPQLAAFGRDLGADIVVRGGVSAAAEPENKGVNINRINATLELDVVRPNDALLVQRFESSGLVSGSDPGMSGEQAIEDAAGKIVQDVLVTAVLAFATQPPPNDFVISVRLPQGGLWLTRARNAISDRFPTSRLQDLQHSPSEARFRLSEEVSLSTLVHRLTDNPFDGFELATVRAVGRELDLELVAKP